MIVRSRPALFILRGSIALVRAIEVAAGEACLSAALLPQDCVRL